MKNKTGQEISGAAMRQLIKLEGCQLDQELTSKLSLQVFQCPDGRVLVVGSKNAGFLWTSRELLTTALNLVERQKPSHVLAGLLKKAEKFAMNASILAVGFQRSQKLPVPSLDNLDECLGAIDRIIARDGVAKYATEDKFDGLLAYVGECVRLRMQNATWVSHLASDETTWEPAIKCSAGTIDIGVLLAKELLEWDSHSSVWGSVRGVSFE